MKLFQITLAFAAFFATFSAQGEQPAASRDTNLLLILPGTAASGSTTSANYAHAPGCRRNRSAVPCDQPSRPDCATARPPKLWQSPLASLALYWQHTIILNRSRMDGHRGGFVYRR